MPAFKDLTGQKFGRLTVLHRAEDHISKGGHHESAWLCQCACGNQVVVQRGNLTSGNTKSCGCWNRDVRKAKREDLTGKVFGRLTVIAPAEDHITPSGIHLHMWLCRCECGNLTTVSSGNLRSGAVKSCGCLQRETVANQREDLTGQTFGQLTVLGPAEDYVAPDGQHRTQWLCQCSCGKQTIVASNRLKSGITKSCGHLNVERVKNEYNLSGDYGIGYTRKNEPFWFDLEDYGKIKDYTWRYDADGYVVTTVRMPNGKQAKVCLHNLIMDPPPDKVVDHQNHPKDPYGHKMDNRKSNLRLATIAQNSQNCNRPKSPASGHVGVVREHNRWRANIMKNGKRLRKTFPGTPEGLAAAIAWRKDMEVKLFGDYRYSAHNPDPDLAAASAPAGAPGSGPGHGDTAGRETAAPA